METRNTVDLKCMFGVMNTGLRGHWLVRLTWCYSHQIRSSFLLNNVESLLPGPLAFRPHRPERGNLPTHAMKYGGTP